MQYFERAVFEHHPENAGTPYEVLLAPTGHLRATQPRYPGGRARPARPAPTTPASSPKPGIPSAASSAPTGRAHGGLAQQGYPLTDEFQEPNKLDGQTYTVQYFERAIFEYHPENAGTPYEVLLTQLGKYWLDNRYPNGTNPAATRDSAAPPPTPPIAAPPPTGRPLPWCRPPRPGSAPTASRWPPNASRSSGRAARCGSATFNRRGKRSWKSPTTGPTRSNLNGWVLRDKNEASQHYSFPAGTLLPGARRLQVYTEPGHPYSFNSNRSIWNNCGDALELVDAQNTSSPPMPTAPTAAPPTAANPGPRRLGLRGRAGFSNWACPKAPMTLTV